jgi:hypothetical protein
VLIVHRRVHLGALEFGRLVVVDAGLFFGEVGELEGGEEADGGVEGVYYAGGDL